MFNEGLIKKSLRNSLAKTSTLHIWSFRQKRQRFSKQLRFDLFFYETETVQTSLRMLSYHDDAKQPGVCKQLKNNF